MLTHDEAKKFSLEWLAAWTGNQPGHLRQFYSRDAFYRDPGSPDGLRGDELLPYFVRLLEKNPEWTWKPVEIFPTETGFILKWMATIPVGDHVVYETGLDIVKLRGGKIVHNEVYFDRTALLNCLNITGIGGAKRTALSA